MNITLTPSFFASAEKILKNYPKSYQDIYNLVAFLSINPRAGDPVPGYNGLIFKVRGQFKSYKEGKSGGLRVYYFFNSKILAPFFSFTKKDMSDAPSKTIAQLVALLMQEFPSSTPS